MPSTRSTPPRRPSLRAWISRSVGGLLKKRTQSPTEGHLSEGKVHPVAPTKDATALLPRFAGLSTDQIHLPQSRKECEAAAQEILAAGMAGFDTEAKPTFKVGEKSTGPHVVQFALTDRAFIFQLHCKECLQTVGDLISSESVLKVGFGLKNDHGQIRSRLGVQLRPVLDLDHIFRQKGYRGQMGVRAAMGAVLRLNFPKSKTVTKSNWAAKELTPRQLLYAANDAHAALKIMEALKLSPAEILEASKDRPERKPRPRRKPRVPRRGEGV